jgi:hypothetical protein
MVVQYAAYLADQYPTKDYIMLGDDIVIYNDAIAKQYKSLMELLGIELSPSKTHVSYTTYEFAKRWFKDGKEFSGVPINGIYQTLGNPIYLLSTILNLYDKGICS